MKSEFLKYLIACCVLFSSCHNDIWDAINALDARVTKLEEICKEMNTNITSLQAIVTVIQTNDQIENVTPITKDGNVIGYVITFTKHEPITIYNGTDGKDGKDGRDGTNGSNGANGKDGKDGNDGITPVIGVAQDTDGVYYWTLNGEWLLDNNGNKLRVKGENGQNGQNGQDGTNGVTPQLTIDEGYWYISYDGGITWTQLGKATGNDGSNVQGSMFIDVSYDDGYVYFTLLDNTVIVVSRKFVYSNSDTAQIVDGAIMAEFSVSPTKKVYFSQGNLQYYASQGTHLCADGSTKPGTWRFAEKQWDLKMIRFEKPTINGDTLIEQDLFSWGESGYMNDFYSRSSDIAQTYYDWGVYNAIANGGNQPNMWRTLTREEWDYLLNTRSDANSLSKWSVLNDTILGLLILPDNFTTMYKGNLSSNIRPTTWKIIEKLGAVFIPITQNGDKNNSYSRSFPELWYNDDIIYGSYRGCVCRIVSSSFGEREITSSRVKIYAVFPVRGYSGGVAINLQSSLSDLKISVGKLYNDIQSTGYKSFHVRLVKDVVE